MKTAAEWAKWMNENPMPIGSHAGTTAAYEEACQRAFEDRIRMVQEDAAAEPKARCDALAALLQYAVNMRGVSQFDFDAWHDAAMKQLAGKSGDLQPLIDGLTAQVGGQGVALKTLRERCALLEKESAIWQRNARTFEETLDTIREALGQESTHYLVVAGDVADVVKQRNDSVAFLAKATILVFEQPPAFVLDHGQPRN